jgi:hypothetical protein
MPRGPISSSRRRKRQLQGAQVLIQVGTLLRARDRYEFVPLRQNLNQGELGGLQPFSAASFSMPATFARFFWEFSPENRG